MDRKPCRVPLQVLIAQSAQHGDQLCLWGVTPQTQPASCAQQLPSAAPFINTMFSCFSAIRMSISLKMSARELSFSLNCRPGREGCSRGTHVAPATRQERQRQERQGRTMQLQPEASDHKLA